MKMEEEQICQSYSSNTIMFDYIRIQTKFIFKQDEQPDKQVLARLYENSITLEAISDNELQVAEYKQNEKSSGDKLFKIIFDFDTIFSILRHKELLEEEGKRQCGTPFGISLQKFQDSIELHVIRQLQQESDEVQIWGKMLTDKLNQRNFHQIFKPLKKIGKGNFASVYLVHKHSNNEQYAAKAFSKQTQYGQERGKQAIENQINIMRNLQNEYLMKLEGVYETQNSLYMCVEYLSGGTLFDHIKKRHKFSVDEIKTIMRCLLNGISAMHQKNIMHRDLKPENIIFRSSQSFECVIADFGLATFADKENYIFKRCGTPGYVAPQISNLKDKNFQYSPICDMFSLGVIFHIIVLGKSPFPGVECNEVLRQNRQCNINFQGSHFEKLSCDSLDLLKKMLQKNPKKRITAKQALNHEYFDQGVYSIPQQLSLKSSSSKYQDCQSPLMISKNAKRRRNLKLRDDSCIKFKMRQQIEMNQNQQIGDRINSPVSITRKTRGKLDRKAKTLYPSNFKS